VRIWCPRCSANCHLAAVTGLRRGEVLALRWKHINFEKQVLVKGRPSSVRACNLFLNRALEYARFFASKRFIEIRKKRDKILKYRGNKFPLSDLK